MAICLHTFMNCHIILISLRRKFLLNLYVPNYKCIEKLKQIVKKIVKSVQDLFASPKLKIVPTSDFYIAWYNKDHALIQIYSSSQPCKKNIS